jgi:hypothetical protein
MAFSLMSQKMSVIAISEDCLTPYWLCLPGLHVFLIFLMLQILTGHYVSHDITVWPLVAVTMD